MVCKYVETCKSCGNKVRWFCTASNPKKRITNKSLCQNPVESECFRYKQAIARDDK